MSLLVVGSLAFDDVESPSGKRENILGGIQYLTFVT